MTDNELRKLSRGDLLELLLQQSTELQELKAKLEEAESALQDRRLKLDQAGSIAEAALQLNGVFEAAQMACSQYMDNIEHLSQRQEEICQRRERESQAKAELILSTAEKQRAEMERSTQQRCMEMVARAEAESRAYWDEVSQRLEAFVAEHAELEQLLSVLMPKRI